MRPLGENGPERPAAATGGLNARPTALPPGDAGADVGVFPLEHSIAGTRANGTTVSVRFWPEMLSGMVEPRGFEPLTS